MSRPAKAIVDLAALRHNYQLAQRIVPDATAIAIIKANAYGHGAIEAARALSQIAPAFGVACIEEAIELRDAGISQPILLLEGPFTADELDIALAQNFWLLVADQSQVDFICEAKLDGELKVWLGADSGMHRLGLATEAFHRAYEALRALPHVNNEIVLATHFAAGDELDNDFTALQVANFKQAIEGIEAPISMSNSAAILGWPESHGQYNRPGIMLYGASPFTEPHEFGDQLKAVMTLESAIIALRDIEVGETVGYAQSWSAQRRSKIATVAMGYGDGYPRHAPSGTPVIVNDQRCKLVGRVSMDMITVDVTDLESAEVGDKVIFWGEDLPLNEVANCAGTISYELVTRMPMRTPRVYIND